MGTLVIISLQEIPNREEMSSNTNTTRNKKDFVKPI